jgi:hypothetical protein
MYANLEVHCRPDPGYHWRMLLRTGGCCLRSSAYVRCEGHSGWNLSGVCIFVPHGSISNPWLVLEPHQVTIKGDTNRVPVVISGINPFLPLGIAGPMRVEYHGLNSI